MQERTEETRRNLILAGMELFARFGLDGVSLRSINEKAGAKNAAATHYHFKSKQGFLKAIVAFIFELPEGRVDAMRREGEQAFMGVDLLFFNLIAPILVLYENKKWGRNALKFLTHLLTTESSQTGIWNNAQIEDGSHLVAKLLELHPKADEAEVKLRLSYALMTIIFGLAAEKASSNSIFGDLSNYDEDHRFYSLLRFATAGLKEALVQ